MTALLTHLRRWLNRRRIKRIEARKALWKREQARYRAFGLLGPTVALELLIVDADEVIRQLREEL